uniref:Uncharacterized protein n=1 Tax=Arundo donax TaxID=35708 RepID=A0A0A9DEK4_ARUDO
MEHMYPSSLPSRPCPSHRRLAGRRYDPFKLLVSPSHHLVFTISAVYIHGPTHRPISLYHDLFAFRGDLICSYLQTGLCLFNRSTHHRGPLPQIYLAADCRHGDGRVRE